MQNVFYRLKTSTMINFLIFFLAATILLQGTLAIYHNDVSSKNALRMASLVISNDVDNLVALFSSIDSFVDMLETDKSFIIDPASDASNNISAICVKLNENNYYDWRIVMPELSRFEGMIIKMLFNEPL